MKPASCAQTPTLFFFTLTMLMLLSVSRSIRCLSVLSPASSSSSACRSPSSSFHSTATAMASERDWTPGKVFSIAPKEKHTATVIFMHGLGDSGMGWRDAMEMCAVRMPHVKFILPTAPTIPVTLNMGMRMPAWYDIISLDKTGRADEEGMELSKKIVETHITKENEEGIPDSRILIGGFSQGGAVALYSGLSHSSALAGIVGMSTYFPLAEEVLEKTTDEQRKTPLIMCHGKIDPVVAYEYGHASYVRVKHAGFDIKFHAFPNLQHSASMEELEIVMKFIGDRLPPLSKQ